MKITQSLLLTILFVLSVAYSHGASDNHEASDGDKNGSLSIAQNCEQWQSQRQENTEQSTLYWLQGFTAAYNQYEYRGKHPQGVLKTSEPEVIAIWLDEYCQNNPQSNPQQAIESLIEEKKPPRKACPVRKSGGRPCTPAKEEEEDKPLPEDNEKKGKWLPW